MMIPEAIRRQVESYHNEWRHPRLAPLVCSKLYSLFPEETAAAMPTEMNWPESWPNHIHAGVYFVFDRTLRLMYIGKTNFFGAPVVRVISYPASELPSSVASCLLHTTTSATVT
jgi:hypothetical protein